MRGLWERNPKVRELSQLWLEVGSLQFDNKKSLFWKADLSWLRSNLESLVQQRLIIGNFHITMLTIGCGLGQLDLRKVKKIIEKLFSITNITITVYVFSNVFLENAILSSGIHCCKNQCQCQFQLHSQCDLLTADGKVKSPHRSWWAKWESSSWVQWSNRSFTQSLNVKIVTSYFNNCNDG